MKKKLNELNSSQIGLLVVARTENGRDVKVNGKVFGFAYDSDKSDKENIAAYKEEAKKNGISDEVLDGCKFRKVKETSIKEALDEDVEIDPFDVAHGLIIGDENLAEGVMCELEGTIRCKTQDGESVLLHLSVEDDEDDFFDDDYYDDAEDDPLGIDSDTDSVTFRGETVAFKAVGDFTNIAIGSDWACTLDVDSQGFGEGFLFAAMFDKSEIPARLLTEAKEDEDEDDDKPKKKKLDEESNYRYVTLSRKDIVHQDEIFTVVRLPKESAYAGKLFTYGIDTEAGGDWYGKGFILAEDPDMDLSDPEEVWELEPFNNAPIYCRENGIRILKRIVNRGKLDTPTVFEFSDTEHFVDYGFEEDFGIVFGDVNELLADETIK